MPFAYGSIVWNRWENIGKPMISEWVYPVDILETMGEIDVPEYSGDILVWIHRNIKHKR